MFIRIRRPLEVPAHFRPHRELADTWAELVTATRPHRSRAVECELATLLLYEQRTANPDTFGADRVQALAGLLRELRR